MPKILVNHSSFRDDGSISLENLVGTEDTCLPMSILYCDNVQGCVSTYSVINWLWLWKISCEPYFSVEIWYWSWIPRIIATCGISNWRKIWGSLFTPWGQGVFCVRVMDGLKSRDNMVIRRVVCWVFLREIWQQEKVGNIEIA